MNRILSVLVVMFAVMSGQVFAGPVAAGPEHQALIKEAEAHITANFKDPYSAKFESLYIGTTYPKKSPVVCGTVNAKNSYGAYVGRKPFYYFNGKGEVVEKDSSAAIIFKMFCVDNLKKP